MDKVKLNELIEENKRLVQENIHCLSVISSLKSELEMAKIENERKHKRIIYLNSQITTLHVKLNTLTTKSNDI